MRRLAIAFAAFLWSLPAFAQTTTWSTTDKSAGITLSGGNLVATTSATNAYKTVRGTNAKYSGKWCYEFTLNNAANDMWVGLGNSHAALDPAAREGQDIDSAALLSLVDSLYYDSLHVDGVGFPTNGKTGAVCVNLDTIPAAIWVTNDVTRTDGAGGGPKWNGSATAQPNGSVSGTIVFFPSYGFFPLFGGHNNDKLTGNFGATSFACTGACATAETGYSTWNTSGGAAPIPGPTSPLTINIANAPAWQRNTAYGLGKRVVAGPGFTQPSTYTDGSNLYLWAVTVAGTSLNSGNGPQTCGSPAGVGGGLDGTIPAGWSGATTATDGSVTWVCLTKANYVTLTGAFCDEPHAWAQNTTYYWNDYVTNAGRCYRNSSSSGGTTARSAPWTCTSNNSGSGPTSTGTEMLTTEIIDNTCGWSYEGDRTYSSLDAIWPHEIRRGVPELGGGWKPFIRFNYDVHLVVWYGGTGRTQYQPGQNGEADPILFQFHNDLSLDHVNTFCMDFGTPLLSTIGPLSALVIDNGTDYGCNGQGTPYLWTFTVAAGDSLVDNPGPLRYDPTRGVAFFSNSVGGVTPFKGPPVGFSDSAGIITRGQYQSTQWSAVDSFLHAGPGQQRQDYVTVQDSLFDAGGGDGAVIMNGSNNITNIVVISRSSTVGCIGIYGKFPQPVNNVTAIGPGNANCTFHGVQTTGAGPYKPFGIPPLFPPPINNNLVFGFPNGLAMHDAWSSVGGINNATDIAAACSTTSFTSGWDGVTYTPVCLGTSNVCGAGNTSSCNSLSAANQFVNATIGPSLDLRLKAGADVIGAGANFSVDVRPFWHGYPTAGIITPGPDIFGITRPQAGRYDPGAQMFMTSGGATVSRPISGVIP